MPNRIEDYAMIGDCQTAALVGFDGSIDWLCLPHFDSGACFAALLGSPENGRWLIAPEGKITKRSRKYRDNTLVLETEFTTQDGVVALIDFMPPRGEAPDIVRIVEGRGGKVPMGMELIVRFDYGWIVPWVRHEDGGIKIVAGPDTLHLHGDVRTKGQDLRTVAEFEVAEGQQFAFTLTWHPSHKPTPKRIEPKHELKATQKWWSDWAAKCNYDGPHHTAVKRSLMILKALTFAPTGGIVAAPTTSLPEQPGGVRNWDYRYCWIRDATFTLLALMSAGYKDEARAWREWLLRAAAGNPAKLQIMYGLDGERRLTEYELDWLKGYEDASPVRVGNDAWHQHQLDVYGEAMDAMYHARRLGLEEEHADWRLERAMLRFLETDWEKPDHGIWEIRDEPRHFTHSKVMAWVAFDRAIRSSRKFGLEGPVDHWEKLRKKIFDEVCERGFSKKRNSFVQSYGAEHLDASLLMIPEVGFLPADDPRMLGTIDAIQKDLMKDGFVLRYDTHASSDGLPPGEGAFLPCTFWLADNLALAGRQDEACELFERLLGILNDVHLISEAWDPKNKRMLGNFPQALTHIGLVNTAYNLFTKHGPAKTRHGE